MADFGGLLTLARQGEVEQVSCDWEVLVQCHFFFLFETEVKALAHLFIKKRVFSF
jgi:hypothetical protein